MSIPVLTILKLLLLLLLYIFLLRALRTIAADLYGPRGGGKTKPPPRPAMADTQATRKRRPPRELIVHEPNRTPETMKLGDNSIVVGRVEDAHIVVDDAYVSDLHAEIVPTAEGWSVRDLGSTNGTFLNGAKVTQTTPLSSGDQVRVGKTRLEVRR